MTPPKMNWGLFVTFAVITIGVFILALVHPPFRAVAYAPLRELVIPPPEPIDITIYYGTEKRDWLQQMREDFLVGNPTVDGHPIAITLEGMGSREMYLAVLDGSIQPTVLSPASSLQISIFQDLSAQKFGTPMANMANSANCHPLVKTPLVLVAWKERGDALWGGDPGDALWQEIHQAAIDPQGWGAYGFSEWGFFKFGHTNPLKSNSGFMAIILLAYEYHQKSSGLTADDIQDPGFQTWFTELESAITDFGDSTGSYMRDIIAYGPSKYDMVAVYESVAIDQAENAIGRYGELFIYYPPNTLMSDHPYCILNADWVDPQQREAAQQFMAFLLSEPAQTSAVLDFGFRSFDQSISLDQPGSPFLALSDNGIQIANLPPEVDIPEGQVLDALLDFWARQID
jgi:hypothetical protein